VPLYCEEKRAREEGRKGKRERELGKREMEK
jgi:hypothetical protein